MRVCYYLLFSFIVEIEWLSARKLEISKSFHKIGNYFDAGFTIKKNM